ncbi:hypothetical protein DSM106972_089360 [Dulcicalothrix desertica PCC 7102]|uniref:Uncharacterized protein n=1 Tax=Dulcicalothrix desertica PCC 7102 TaxID=232991 RepID=A0A3S1IDU0_9CYAN|nr:hypothetical protein [Dulcicalothrix desertica]RUS95923.1 hypothetical protein DSM106972_089360 [Dulcicalothrix desertica PCC 7102]TWH39557.1 hypothetical protein CAL7102_08802 [Dulcicalothrix desertica PCC 7102]
MSIEPENIEQRVANLEAEVALIKSKLQSDSKTPWWEAIVGKFALRPCV